MSTATSYILHDDHTFFSSSIRSFARAGSTVAFVSCVPWHGDPGSWEETARVAEAAGVEVVLGEWPSELEHREAAIAHLLERGLTHAQSAKDPRRPYESSRVLS
jgi:hypothetical protein